MELQTWHANIQGAKSIDGWLSLIKLPRLAVDMVQLTDPLEQGFLHEVENLLNDYEFQLLSLELGRGWFFPGSIKF